VYDKLLKPRQSFRISLYFLFNRTQRAPVRYVTKTWSVVLLNKKIHIRKANWIGHILRRNCLPKQVTEGKIKGQIEVTGRRGRRRKKLLDDLKDSRGYCELKEENLDRTVWRNRFERGFGPFV